MYFYGWGVFGPPGRENCRAVGQGIWLPNLGGAWGEVPPGEGASAFPILFVCQSVALRASCREEINWASQQESLTLGVEVLPG